MSLHSLAMALYKRLKNLPLVGRVLRWGVDRAKIAFASWHYSNNRLQVQVGLVPPVEEAPAPQARRPSPDELQERLGRMEASALASQVGEVLPITLVVMDEDGLRTKIDWRPELDLSRLVHPGHAAAIAISHPEGRIRPDALWGAFLSSIINLLGPDGVLQIVIRDFAEELRSGHVATAIADMSDLPFRAVMHPEEAEEALRRAGLLHVSARVDAGLIRIAAVKA